MGHKFLRKLFSFFLSFLLLFQGSAPYLVAFAQEAGDSTPSAEIVVEPPAPTEAPQSEVGSPTPESAPEITPTPTPTPTLDPTPTATPSATPNPTPTITPDPTPEASPSATPTATPTPEQGEILDGIATESAGLRQGKIPLQKTGDFLKNVKKQAKKNYVEGEVIVKFKKEKFDIKGAFGKAQAFVFEKRFSLEKRDEIKSSNIQVFKSKKSTEEMVKELKSDSNVEYVQPNYIYEPTTIGTNDTYKDLLWGLDNTGQTVNGTAGTTDKDIDAPEAWGTSEGNGTIVAVIDSGVAYNHPDLVNSMWNGTNCKGDDGSFWGGCNSGYDYEDGDKIPLPSTSSHGTHIAGTIAAVKNNAKGIIGVAPQTKIMALKSSLTTTDNVKSINFAQQNGAKIINASWGCYGSDQGGSHAVCGTPYEYDDFAMIDAINNFPGLFVTAAGNGDGDSDYEGDNHDSGEARHSYPCDHTGSNIICVAATDQNDNLASFSDYGASSVDVGAPGTNIYSTGFTQEIFTNAALPNFSGTLFTKSSGSWLTSTWDGIDKNTRANTTYINNDDGILTLTNPIDTTVIGGNVTMKFYLQANIEYEPSCSWDYLLVEVDNNDNNWVTKAIGCGVFNQYVTADLGPGKPNMRIRFNWHTDPFVTGTQVPFIDNISISNTHDYQYMDGTSMAAPHVAGLAALIEGYNPNLTSTQVKDIILNTGDTVSGTNGLVGKTVTGKRINAKNALDASIPLSSEKAITAFTVPGQTGETVINESAHTIGITVPFGTNVTALVPTITTTGVSVNPASGVANNFSTPKTYTVTAADSSTQAYIVTVTISADPIATAFDSISTSLAGSPNNVANNLNDVTSANISSFSGLYFEKSISGTPVGKLTFTGGLDLSSDATKTFLQNLGTKLDQGQGRIALNATESAVFAAARATLVMYDMPAVGEGNLIVRDDAGTILDPTGIVSDFTQATPSGDITFNTAHFTQFDIDTTKPVIAAHANVGPVEATSGSGAPVSYTSPNTTDNIDPDGPASCAPVSGSTFALGPTTVTCNKTDTAGNAATPTTFTVTVSDTTAPSVPGTPTTTSPTNDTTPTWSWTAASDAVGIDHYIFYWDTVSGGETNFSNSLSSATVNFTHSSALGSGTWYGKVRAYDANGNSTVSAVGSVVIDAELPVGNIAINGGAPYTNSNDVALNFSGVSADVTAIELGNGVSGSYQSSIVYENPHAYTLPSNGDGTYTVRVRFTDSVGNVNAGTISDNIILDKTNPTDPTDVHSTSHTVDVPTTVNSIDMVWTAAGSAPGATDGGSGVDGYSYSFTQGATDVPDTTKDAEETTTTTSSSALAEGSWYFHLRTLDTAGNWTSTVHIGPFIIDTTKPVIASHDDVTAEATSVSGAVVTYTLPIATDNVDAAADASCTPVSGSTFSIGTTTVTCTKSDAAGNTATPTSFTITVTANTPPSFDAILNQSVNEDASAQNISITNISPGPAGEAGQTVTLSATSGDTTIVPSPSVSGSGSTRTLTYTPAANKYGSVTVTVVADDGQTLFNTFSRTFTIIANPINDAPVGSGDTASVNEDSILTIAKSSLLANDTDVEGNTLSLTAVSNPVHGSVAIDGDNVTFTPTANYTGSASFDYTVSDGSLTGTGTVAVAVNPVNDAPVATNSSVSATEETPVVISLSGSDIDGNTLVYSIVDNPTHGTFSTISGNQVTYTPSTNYTGPDSFTFKVHDGTVDSNTATVSITVSEYNDPPVLDPIGNKSVDELATLTFTAVATDPDNTPTYSLTNAPTGATINSSTGVFSFTPTEAQGPGTYTLTVNATDGTSTDSEEITITVNEVNVAPVASDVTISTNEDTAKSITLNATDVDLPDQTLTYSIVTNPSHGTLSAVSGNPVTYTPSANYNGSDSFTYKTNDEAADSNTATVNITVTAVGDPTVLSPIGNKTVDELATLSFIATATDPDNAITYSLTNTPTGATINSSTGVFSFTPTEAQGPGTYTLTVHATDGTSTDSEEITITVNEVNVAPVANDVSVSTNEDTTKNITLSATDTDLPAQGINYSLVTNPAHGTLDAIIDGKINYTPVANYYGTDSFTYKANDGGVDSNTATVNITVVSVNDLPVASDGAFSTGEDVAKVITLSATDSDLPAQTLTYSVVSDPSHGTLSLASENQITYTPNASYLGTDAFTFKANDGVYDSNTATITITIQDITSPTVTKLGDDSIDVALPTGTTNLVFSEELSASSKLIVQNALTSGADKALSYSWTGGVVAITATETTTFANDVVVNVSDLAGNTTNSLLLVDSSLTATQTTPNGDGNATADSDSPEVVITDPDQEVTVTVDGTTDATIDLSSLVDGGTGDIPQITINSDTADIAIPATTVTGPIGWDGVIAAPTVTTVTLPVTTGETSTLGTAIEIGFAADKLSFTNAVRILLPGQAGKRAGYSRPGTAFTEITSTCAADSQAAGDALGVDAECKIDAGADMVIWTKHFTKFASYTQTINSTSTSSSTSSGGGTTSASAPTCNDTKPGSAPVLLSAVSAGANSVILTWSKAADPVTYYLITFGWGSGLQQYGNPNVGGSNTTSYTVSGLSGGTTYYFKVRAGNGCAPGAFSNELSATPAGGVLTTVPGGFEAGVLGETTEVKTPESTPTPTPEVKGAANTSDFNWWLLTIPGALLVLFISGLLLRRRT